MSEPLTSSDAALAVSLGDLRRVTEVGLEKVAGQLGLLVQRMDQADERSNHFAQRIEDMQARVGQLERAAVTVDMLNARTQRLYVVLGLFVSAVGVAAALVGLRGH